MSEWIEVSLGELGEIFDGPHATPTRRDAGPYFLNIASLKDGRLDLSESDHVSPEDFDRWTRRVTPQEGDLLFAYETRLGEAALMPAGIKACLGRRMALIRPRREMIDPRFFLYLYLSPQMKRTISMHAVHGATVDRIPLKTMSSWTLRVPPMKTQRAIAEVLGALDEKITANTKRWKSGLEFLVARYRGLAAHADRWFPLGEAYSVGLSGVWGVDQPSAEFSVRTTCLRGRDLEQYMAGEVPDAPTRYISPRQAERRRWGIGEIWTAGSGTLGPSMVMSPEIASSWPAVVTYSNFVKRLIPAESFKQYSVAWLAMVDAAKREMFGSYATGTAIPNLDVKALLDGLLVPAVRDDEARELGEQVRILTHPAPLRENEILASTRDALLAALMSNKLRVRDAERVAEEVA